METEDLAKETSIKIPLGHLLLTWEVLSDKFSDLRAYDSLLEEDRRAIWGLADLLERSLIENGFTEKSSAEWKVLIDSSREFMKTVPIDCLD